MSSNKLPIVIGGCHRSGTSLVRRILNAHSRIYCGPEVKFFRDFYNHYFYDPLQRERFLHTAHSILPESDLLQVLGTAFIEMHARAAVRAGKIRWADKNPENVLYLDAWEQLLASNWVFVHVVRNPLDTLASIKEAQFDDTIPPALEARIAFYQRYTQAGLNFGSEHPSRYYRLVYEELVTQPQTVLSGLMDWLGESLEPLQLDFGQAEHQYGLEDAKVRQTTRIHTESVQRWNTILSRQEAAVVYGACAELWRQIDPAEKWINYSDQALSESEGREIMPAHLQANAALDQDADSELEPSARIMRETFELKQNLAASQQWVRELLEQIAARDRELARIKSLLPIRMAMSAKRVLTRH